MRIEMPCDVEWIIGKIRDYGFEAFAVGGCVRDTLLGREPGDWDITTSAKPEEVKEIFGKTVDTGLQHGTVTIIKNKNGYEVTNDKGWILAYHEMIRDYEKEKMERDSSSPMTYSLVYLNDDEIPELVIGNTGYWVSVYTWYYGKTVAVIEGWNYGASCPIGLGVSCSADRNIKCKIK